MFVFIKILYKYTNNSNNTYFTLHQENKIETAKRILYPTNRYLNFSFSVFFADKGQFNHILHQFGVKRFQQTSVSVSIPADMVLLAMAMATRPQNTSVKFGSQLWFTKRDKLMYE